MNSSGDTKPPREVSERPRSGPRAADVPAGRGGGARRRGSRHHGPAAATHEVVGLGQDMAQVSRGSKDIRRFSQDMGAFEGDQLDGTTLRF